MATKADLVLVEWHDAHSNSSWVELSEAESAHKPATAFSVGWLLRRDSVGISMFASIVDDDMFGERIFIPAGMVKKVQVLIKARRK